jgi:hypothetical protein
MKQISRVDCAFEGLQPANVSSLFSCKRRGGRRGCRCSKNYILFQILDGVSLHHTGQQAGTPDAKVHAGNGWNLCICGKLLTKKKYEIEIKNNHVPWYAFL